MKGKRQKRWCMGALAVLAGLTVHAALRLYRDRAATQVTSLQEQCTALEHRLKKLQAIQEKGLELPAAHASLAQAFSKDAAQLLQETCAALGGHNIVIAREESIPGALPEMHLPYQRNRYRVGLSAPISAIKIAAALPDRLPQLYQIEGISCCVQEKGYNIVLILSLIEEIAAR